MIDDTITLKQFKTLLEATLEAKLDPKLDGIHNELTATNKTVAMLVRESATKVDISELRSDMGGLRQQVGGMRLDLEMFRQENGRQHLELFRILREEMYTSFARADPQADPT